MACLAGELETASPMGTLGNRKQKVLTRRKELSSGNGWGQVLSWSDGVSHGIGMGPTSIELLVMD